eukprot:3941506-Rhodomonas_salina.1
MAPGTVRNVPYHNIAIVCPDSRSRTGRCLDPSLVHLYRRYSTVVQTLVVPDPPAHQYAHVVILTFSGTGHPGIRGTAKKRRFVGVGNLYH